MTWNFTLNKTATICLLIRLGADRKEYTSLVTLHYRIMNDALYSLQNTIVLQRGCA